MGDAATGHELGERLYVARDTVIHRLPAHLKILAAVTTILLIVATPATAVPAFAGYAVLVAVVVALARLPLRVILPRMVVEVPFVAFALLLPVLGTDPRVPVGPVSLSEPGLWAAWSMLVKATLGVVMSIVLAATTSTRSMVEGLHRLHVPDVIVGIFASMLRYVHVVGAEAARMSRARAARGFSGRGPRSWPVLGQSLGTLFIRSYERGERVHLAMLSRGYSGRLPVTTTGAAGAGQVLQAATLPMVAALIWAAARWGLS